MRTLKIRQVRTNPWLVLTRELPEWPDRFLLKAALAAAEYCRVSERNLMEAASDGRYIHHKWSSGSAVSAFEESKFYYEAAGKKIEEMSVTLINVLNAQMRVM